MYNIIWYNGDNFSTKITKSMLISKGNKKIVSKSQPYINIGSGFDCETSQFDNHEIYIKLSEEYKNALKSFVYIWQFSVGNDIYLCRDVKLFEKFIIQLDNVCNVHKNAKLIVWDANLKFEYSFFKHILRKYITKIFAKTKNDILMFNVLNHLEFRECLGVFGKSLEEIAKNHTKTQKLKGDLDYSLIRTPYTEMEKDELQYSINDVAILSELTAVAHEMYTLKGDKIPLTQTGIVRNEIKKNYAPTIFKTNDLYNINKKLIGTKQEYNEYRKYVYSGGLTHSNFKYVGEKINDIVCYDLISAYPWALNVKKYPAGDMIKVKDSKDFKEAFKHKHWFMLITLYDVGSKSTHSTLSKHKVKSMVKPVIDNGRIYKCECLTAYFTEIDWYNFRQIYKFNVEKSKIHEVTYFTKSQKVPDKILNVMNDWYKKKTILKPHAKESIENKKMYAKLKQLINSVYGMTVTALFTNEVAWNENICDIEDNIIDWEKASNTIFNPWWGYYCTAYVRQRLIDMISQYPDEIVQYDTDSIYCFKSDKLDNAISKINNDIYMECVKNIKMSECWDLGQWDNDGYYKYFMALGSKRYVGIENNGDVKIVFAGANKKDIIKNAKENNMDILEYCKHINIDETISNKLGAYHFDGYYSNYVTDYKGNTYLCETYGGTTVKNVSFKANLSHMFDVLKKEYLQ